MAAGEVDRVYVERMTGLGVGEWTNVLVQVRAYPARCLCRTLG
jgi:hypothetical protein